MWGHGTFDSVKKDKEEIGFNTLIQDPLGHSVMQVLRFGGFFFIFFKVSFVNLSLVGLYVVGVKVIQI